MKPFRSQCLVLAGVGLALSSAVLSSAVLASGPAREVSFGFPPGERVATGDLGVTAELIDVRVEAIEALRATPVGGRLTFSSFPTAPGWRERVELRRLDVYAPGARVWVVDGTERREVPRSRRLHFNGFAPDDPSVRLSLSVDPDTGAMRGFVRGSEGDFDWLEPAGDDPRYRLESTAAAVARLPAPPVESCDNDLASELTGGGSPPLEAGLAVKALDAPTYSAIVAFDTDNELLTLKFGGSTAAAADWIADFIAAANVIYERDVLLRLLVGDTFLRTGASPYTSDPWGPKICSVAGTSCLVDAECPMGEICFASTLSQLYEFGGYWEDNMGAVDRTFAMLLSGKAYSSFSSAGIAWVDGYCEKPSTGGGYSVVQAFRYNGATYSSGDTMVPAHELGHNAGSPHTHCYSPPVDTCYALEGGCYAGAVSCPVTNGGKGTLMSYCHLSSGASCGSNVLLFDDTQVQPNIEGYIAAHTASCLTPIATDEIFSDGFESGNTSAWSSTIP